MTLRTADIDAYFARIGWSGPVAVDRATLNAIAAHHPAAIPFENLDPYLDRPVDLSPEALVAKLIHGQRGGYCFEQNGLLRLVLERIRTLDQDPLQRLQARVVSQNRLEQFLGALGR